MKRSLAVFLALFILSLLLVSCIKKPDISVDSGKSSAASQTDRTSLEQSTPEPTTPSPDPTTDPVSSSVSTEPTVSTSTNAETETPPSTEPTPSVKEYNLTGSFSSDTGTTLNLEIVYAVTTVEAGLHKVTVTVYLDSYSLSCNSRTNCNTITIGDNDYVFSTGAIVYNSGTGRHRTELSTAEALYTDEELPEELQIGATWLFKGTYSQVEIDTLEVSGSVALYGE